MLPTFVATYPVFVATYHLKCSGKRRQTPRLSRARRGRALRGRALRGRALRGRALRSCTRRGRGRAFRYRARAFVAVPSVASSLPSLWTCNRDLQLRGQFH